MSGPRMHLYLAGWEMQCNNTFRLITPSALLSVIVRVARVWSLMLLETDTASARISRHLAHRSAHLHYPVA